MDDAAVNLRAYLADLSDDHLTKYDTTWSDEQVVEWDGNFRNDGSLMLVCCHRDVDITEFREALHEHLQLRGI